MVHQQLLPQSQGWVTSSCCLPASNDVAVVDLNEPLTAQHPADPSAATARKYHNYIISHQQQLLLLLLALCPT